jgi:hypothetical protein
LICFPFRWIHVYLHIYAAKQVIEEIEEKKERDEAEKTLDIGNLRASLISGLDIADENPGLLMAFNRVNYAKKVALAPNKFALIMLLGYFIVTPLAFSEGQIFSSDLGALVHLYLFLGIFGVLMPSTNDWYFIVHTLMINTQIRPIWIYHSVFVYLIFTFDNIWRYQDFFLAILYGTFWFLVYIIGLFVSSFIAQGGKLRNPKIYFVPIKSSREIKANAADIEFLSLEDLDL